LARRLLRKHQRRHGRTLAPLSAEPLHYLEAHSWPGNVRELSHLLEAALILSEDGAVEIETLRAAEAMADWGDETPRDRLGRSEGGLGMESPTSEASERNWGVKKMRYAFLGTEDEEREVIRLALARVQGNRSQAARELGMARNTLRQKLRKYGLQ
jgi:DNA-binding NtrC family response regulator